jgi:alpha-beta hydrolase superfamily lysophospholipase
VTFVTSRDGVRLRAVHLPGPAATDVAVVLVPGFSCSWDKPFVRRAAGWLSAHAAVVTVDLRGHGRSGGLSTLGDREVLDVDAAVAEARRRGYARVVTVGFSMGGAAVLRHAGLLGTVTEQPVDAVVSVSAASRWWRVETPRMRWLARICTTAPGRRYAQTAMATRIDPQARYGESAETPEAVIGRIAPVPVLVVHGGRDRYLRPGNAEDLFAAAGEPRELWLWPEYGHAELALDAAGADLLGRHLAVLLDQGPVAGRGGEPREEHDGIGRDVSAAGAADASTDASTDASMEPS